MVQSFSDNASDPRRSLTAKDGGKNVHGVLHKALEKAVDIDFHIPVRIRRKNAHCRARCRKEVTVKPLDDKGDRRIYESLLQGDPMSALSRPHSLPDFAKVRLFGLLVGLH